MKKKNFQIYFNLVLPFVYGHESNEGGWPLIPKYQHHNTETLYVYGDFYWLFLKITWNWVKD